MAISKAVGRSRTPARWEACVPRDRLRGCGIYRKSGKSVFLLIAALFLCLLKCNGLPCERIAPGFGRHLGKFAEECCEMALIFESYAERDLRQWQFGISEQLFGAFN